MVDQLGICNEYEIYLQIYSRIEVEKCTLRKGSRVNRQGTVLDNGCVSRDKGSFCYDIVLKVVIEGRNLSIGF